jgi:hypothetical protein
VVSSPHSKAALTICGRHPSSVTVTVSATVIRQRQHPAPSTGATRRRETCYDIAVALGPDPSMPSSSECLVWISYPDPALGCSEANLWPTCLPPAGQLCPTAPPIRVEHGVTAQLSDAAIAPAAGLVSGLPLRIRLEPGATTAVSSPAIGRLPRGQGRLAG